MNYKLLFILFIQLFPFYVFGQDPYHINYDTKDGLPSSEVYAVEVDSNGIVWFATDRGICSYNGYEFKTFTTDDGLANNTLLTIWKDRKGNFWFPGLDGSLSIYDHEKFFPYKWNDSLKINLAWPEKIAWDNDDNLYFWNSGESNKIKYSIDNQSGRITQRPFEDLAQKHKIIRVQNADFIEMSGYYLPDDDSFRAPMVIKKDSFLYFNHKPNKIKPYSRYLFKHSLIDSSEEFIELENSILNLYLDKSEHLWVCTTSGLYFIKDADFINPPKLYFEGISITQIRNDLEGNYWITTLQNGIFKIPSFEFNAIRTQFSNYGFEKVLSIATL